MTNTPTVKLNPREWETVAQRLDWMIEVLERLATTWTGRQEGRLLDFGHGEISPEEALEQIIRIADELERTFTSERTRDHALKLAHQNDEDTAAVGLRFERLSRLFGRLSGLTLEHSPIPHTPPFTPETIDFISARPAIGAMRAILAGSAQWQRPEGQQPYYLDKDGVTVYAQEGADFNPLALDAA